MTTAPHPPRVLMLTDALERGGLERVVVDLSRGLAERGHAVTVAAEAGGPLWDDLPDGVERLHAPPRTTAVEKLRYATWLTAHIRSGAFDIVHAHQRGVALQARAARSGTRARVVEHVHNIFRPGPDRWLSFRGDHLIACGRTVADMLVHDFGRDPRRIATVANSVPDLGVGRSLALPATTGAPLPTLVAVGRLSPQKDPHRFLDVVAALNTGMQRVRAFWVGGGELLAECRDEVVRRGIPGLEFVGDQDDVASFLALADLFVSTSRWEGLPLVLLEAASMGRGMIAPRIGGCPEVIEDGVNGLLFDVDADAAEIARLVGKVLDPTGLAALGAAARRTYLARPGAAEQLTLVQEVYRRALAA
ncbi:glycosyltransferase [Geodermatophilus sp. URMC 64]